MSIHSSDDTTEYPRTANLVRLRVSWSDIDLIELEATFVFGAWGGSTRAYCSRGELVAFADQLDAFRDGAPTAALHGGGRELGYVELELFEVDRARHTAMLVCLGSGGAREGPLPARSRHLERTVPVEREPLAHFSAALRRIVTTAEGEALLPLPPVSSVAV